jgi:hypothetical protein
MSARKGEPMQDKSDVDAVLEADARKLVSERVEPELAVFKAQLTRRLRSALGTWCQELNDRGGAMRDTRCGAVTNRFPGSAGAAQLMKPND